MAHEIPVIEAKVRERLGSKYARRLRAAGRLPVVIYGHKQDAVHASVEGRTLIDHLHHGAHLLEIRLDSGATENCLVKDLQWDYLGETVIHIDLTRVDLTEEVTVEVPIELRGQADCVGLKTAGAFLEEETTELEVRCVATNIPDHIVVDVSRLDVNDTIHAGDLTMPEGVILESDPETRVVTVHVAKAMDEEEVAEEGAATAEPEVLSEKKDKEEEGKD